MVLLIGVVSQWISVYSSSYMVNGNESFAESAALNNLKILSIQIGHDNLDGIYSDSARMQTFFWTFSVRVVGLNRKFRCFHQLKLGHFGYIFQSITKTLKLDESISRPLSWVIKVIAAAKGQIVA